jgi:cob(I)alamin adenosyltransferase
MEKEWKIYTKTGDKGETALIGGERVLKSHERIEAYGTLDELNAFVALVHDQTDDNWVRAILLRVQDRVFVIESHFAAGNENALQGLPLIEEEDILELETAIDKMNETLPPLSSFILPSGHPLVSATHVARTVCRRAERCMVRVSRDLPTDHTGIKYINRLSDFLFVLARKLAYDNHAVEVLWKPAREK